jgi:hypothetical protein
MANSHRASAIEFEEPPSNTIETKYVKPTRRIPKRWILAALLFYIASVVTVGLLAGLLPKRIQHITILGTPTSTTTAVPTTADPSVCIDDECNPRLLSDIIVDKYELEYQFNHTEQTTVPGRVKIEFTLKQPIKQLIYHSKRLLELEPPALYEDDVYRFVSMKLYLPNDYVSLRLTSNDFFAPNKYTLVQNFVVNLTDGNVGFYQNVYKDGNDTMQ